MENKVLTCQASECLGLVPVLANVVANGLMRNPCAAIRAHATCFMRLVLVIELLVNSARFMVSSEDLATDIKEYLTTFKDLYGPAYMQPKFHQLVHFIWMLARLGSLPNCFVLERKHRRVKHFAQQNNQSAEGRNHSTACMR